MALSFDIANSGVKRDKKDDDRQTKETVLPSYMNYYLMHRP